MLKVWNVSLIVGTFTLALLGTFLVRSGVLESIHAFGASTVGGWFLVLIAVVLAGSTALIVSRLDDLRSERRIDSLLSRESIFLLNNLVLVGLWFVIFWGTFFPLISEAVTGDKASVGPPWFDRYTVPLALVLVLLSGVGPLLAWRRVTLASCGALLRRPGRRRAGGARRAARCFTDAAESPLSLVDVRVRVVHDRGGAVRVRARGAHAARVSGEWARRGADVGRAPQPAPLRRLHRAPRRRRADARASPPRRRSTRSATCGWLRARPHGSAATTCATCDPRPTSRTRSSTSARCSTCARTASRSALLRPSRNYFPSQDVSMGHDRPVLPRRVDQRGGPGSGLARDVWTAMQPDLQRAERADPRGNRRFADAAPQVQAIAIAALPQRYVRKAPPATFRLIVNPMVTWIWLGGLIVARRRAARAVAVGARAPAAGVRASTPRASAASSHAPERSGRWPSACCCS